MASFWPVGELKFVTRGVLQSLLLVSDGSHSNSTNPKMGSDIAFPLTPNFWEIIEGDMTDQNDGNNDWITARENEGLVS